MIATIWRFQVNHDAIATFERIYGPHGDWAQLFRRCNGYAGTELLKLDGEEPIYGRIPLLGESNDDVLSELLGYSSERIVALKENKVL